MACADEVLDFKRDGRKSPQLSRWKAKALIDSGKKDAPRVEMKALPNDAPESARQTWPVVRSLVEVRRLLDDDDDMPLVVPFLRRWCERTVPEDTLIAGRRWLDRHGYIEHAGEIPTGAGKPMVLWKVACLPRHEQAILDDLYDLLGAREVEA
jgi:hypothetical protein